MPFDSLNKQSEKAGQHRSINTVDRTRERAVSDAIGSDESRGRVPAPETRLPIVSSRTSWANSVTYAM